MTSPPLAVAFLALSFLMPSAYPLAAQSTTVTPPAGRNISITRLQRELTEKTDEIRGIERDEIKPLLDYYAQFENRKGGIAKISLKADVKELTDKIENLLKEFSAEKGKINLQDPRISQLKDLGDELPSDVSDAVENAPPAPPRTTNSLIIRALDGVVRPVPEKIGHVAFGKLLAGLGTSLMEDELFEIKSSNPAKVVASTWESLKADIASARTELAEMNKRLPKAVEQYRTAMTEYYASAAKSLNSEIAVRQARIKQIQDERDKKELEMDKAGEKQADINTLLVYAVYGMVLAIVGLFLLLRFFPAELARAIVIERTMIELLSMGFLLLTVIILGTGKLIGAETLGALLGTIAGYIFGQKQGERKGATEERAKMVDLLRGAADFPTPPHPKTSAEGPGKEVPRG